MEKWLPMIIRMVLEKLSPVIASGLDKWLEDLEKSSKKTDNPWDDLFVDILKFLLGKN